MQIGPYEVTGELGRGGMGVVYRARHTQSGQEVALKVILAGEGATEEQIKRFRREVTLSKTLDHPGIVKVLDSGEEAGRAWFAMELVEGKSLAEIAATEEMDWRRAVEIVRDVADALAHAHEKGILHRDVKPANILIGTKVGPPGSKAPPPPTVPGAPATTPGVPPTKGLSGGAGPTPPPTAGR